jgi:hypothetical protein
MAHASKEVFAIIAGQGVSCHRAHEIFQQMVLVTISEQAAGRVQPVRTLISYPKASA